MSYKGGLGMRLLNKDNILEQVEYINKILRGKKKGFTRIATEDFNITSEELLNQLKSFGYSKVKNQFVLQDEGESVLQVNIVDEGQSVGPVSYTHLDVYKRQTLFY